MNSHLEIVSTGTNYWDGTLTNVVTYSFTEFKPPSPSFTSFLLNVLIPVLATFLMGYLLGRLVHKKEAQ